MAGIRASDPEPLQDRSPSVTAFSRRLWLDGRRVRVKTEIALFLRKGF